jgi:hypothetical protein
MAPIDMTVFFACMPWIIGMAWMVDSMYTYVQA